MRKMWKKALASILTLAMAASSFSGFAAQVQAADTGKVTADVKGDSVVIGNGYISREFSIADDKLSTVKITNKRTDNGDTVFTPAAGSEEFIIRTTKNGDDSAATVLEAMDRTGWTATADSYHNASGPSDGPGSNLLDGNLDSIWHTNYGGGTGDQAYPYNVVITLNGEKTFNCFSYTPRQQGEGTNGNVKGYELWASTAAETLAVDAEGWTKVAEGNFKYNGVNPIYVNLDEACTATQVKFVATSSNNGQSFAGGAEFNLHEEAAPVEKNDREFAASALELDGEPVVEDTTATINKVEKTGKKITFSFKPYTFKDVEWTIKEVVVMYDGDHFMRKYMEIEIPEGKEEAVAIDYIDLESLKVNASDAQWTIPTNAGGVVEMDQFKANLGQPIYIQGMFFGCEFPETDTEIVDGTGYMRYYTGKNFKQFKEGNQLTTDGKYVTWQTVAGAARSTDNQVIQADFFEYIYSIATPSDFRIQYNSWFDNMMLISDETILKSFIEIDRELNKAETRPLDSYVVDDGWINYNNKNIVDANRAGTTLNQTGFWEFNSKFPNGLTTSSDLVHNFGSNFGVWVGPRGGYNFYWSLADIIAESGKGSKAGNSIDVADSTYHENLTKLFTDWQKEYGVNYWKWDGFADRAQYNAFPAADGVPGYANDHMTGGYQHMYHVTDLWEGWIDIFEAVRASEEADGINKLWLSLTCYTNPSPWFLQWANSVWLQCTHDQNDSGSSSSKMDRQLTYRDAAYYEFINKHQFQFPLANVYNHDPIYGKEGTGMNKNTATDEQFKNYLYAQSARGTAFWELYYSDSLMTDGKYEVTSEFLAWAEANNHMLRNAKMFGGHPSTSVKLSSGGGAYSGTQDAYGFAGFDGTDGIITIRNAAQSAKTVTMKFDRTIGVPEDAGTLKYHIEHSHNLTADTPATGEFEYGKEYTFTLQADEVRMFRVSKDGDQAAPEFTRAFSDGEKEITVKFNEKVTGDEFTVAGAAVESVEKSADGITYRITVAEALADNAAVEVTAGNIKDLAGNACTDTISFVNYKGNVVAKGAAAAEESLIGDNGFTVAATVETAKAGAVVAQGDAYELAINADGYATFTVNGSTAVSKTAVADGDTIVGVKENNGIQKIYVNGTLEASAYDAANRYYDVAAAAITVENATAAIVHSTAFGYDTVANVYETPGGEEETLQIPATSMTVTGSSTDDTEAGFDKSAANAIDGDVSTFWATAPGTTLADASYVIELDNVYTINQVDYTKRYDSGAIWNCTGNLLDITISVSTDGENWTEVTTTDTIDGTTEVKFDAVEAKFVKVTASKSYHWQEASANTIMTIAELAVYKVPEVKPAELPLDAIVNTTTGNYEVNGGAAEGPAANATDDDESTIWHTDWYPEDGNTYDDHWLQLELDGYYAISGFKYLPRQSSSSNGDITGYQIQVSVDGKNWKTVSEGTWEAGKDWKEAAFEAQTAKYVRLQPTATLGDQPTKHFSAAAEVRVVGVPTTYVPTEPTVDKTALEAAIAAAEKLNAEDYKDFSAVKELLVYAKNLAATETISQAEVDLATEELNAAIEALEAKPVDPPVVSVDKSGLQTMVDDAKAGDYSKYTEESVAALNTAIAAAEKVLTDENATQEDVNNAKSALVNAVLGLKEKEEPVDPPVVDEDEVVRLYGQGRYDTAYAVADALKEALGVDKFEAAVVATGKNFADALAGSYLAVEKNAPILLTNGNDDNVAKLHEYIAANVEAGGKVYILGGDGAVPTSVDAIDGYEVERLFGDSRYDTNLAILNEAGVTGDSIIVATGKTFADSLSASAAKLPILLVKSDAALNDAQKAVLDGMKNIYIAGGEGAVSAEYEAELAAFGEVTRVFGESRYDTSVAIAKTFCKDVDKAVVASGKNFPDGLCGGPLAAALNAPLILTKDGGAGAAAGYVAENGIASGFVLGGDGALADETVVEVFALESAAEIK